MARFMTRLMHGGVLCGALAVGGCSVMEGAGDYLTDLWPFSEQHAERATATTVPIPPGKCDSARADTPPKLDTHADAHLIRAARLERDGDLDGARVLYLWLTTATPGRKIDVTCGDGIALSGTVAGLAAARLSALEARLPTRTARVNGTTAPDRPQAPVTLAAADRAREKAAPVRPVGKVRIDAQPVVPVEKPTSMGGVVTAQAHPKPPREQPDPARINVAPVSRFTPPQTAEAVMPSGTVSETLSGYSVQLASYRNVKEAQHGWGLLQKRYRTVIGDRKADILRTDLGTRGVFYRVSVTGFDGVGQSVALCDALLDAGADCVIREPNS